MGTADDDLSAEWLRDAMPAREIQVYSTLVSTESVAMARARAGAAEGTLVVAENQISARCRPGRPWPVGDHRSLALTLVVRPRIPPTRGGILYLAATTAAAEILGDGAVIDWPDEVVVSGELGALVSVHLEATVRGLEWALVNVMVPTSRGPRGPLLAALVAGLERWAGTPGDELLAAWSPRCRTLGHEVLAVLFPIGAGRRVEGPATGVRANGALVVEIAPGRDFGVKPQEVASIELADVRGPMPSLLTLPPLAPTDRSPRDPAPRD